MALQQEAHCFFMTLEYSHNSPSDQPAINQRSPGDLHRKITWTIFGMDPNANFSRRFAGDPPENVGPPSNHLLATARSPGSEDESRDRWQITRGSPVVHRWVNQGRLYGDRWASA